RTLARGARLVATLNQPAYAPWPVEEQVAVIFAANQGFLDPVQPGDVPRFNEDLRLALREEGAILADVRETRDLSEETSKRREGSMRRRGPARGGERGPPPEAPAAGDAGRAERGGEEAAGDAPAAEAAEGEAAAGEETPPEAPPSEPAAEETPAG